MTHNIYEAPKSELIDQVSESEAEFYVVSIQKFLVLFAVTLGIYSVYWFYKNWAQYKIVHNGSMWPVMRGIFSIFFAHSLFRVVNQRIEEKSKEYSWQHSSLATIYVVCSIVSNISDRLSMKNIGTPFTDFLGLLMIAATGYALYKAQYAINLACDDPDGTTNLAYTPANFVWIVIGAILWFLVFLGIFVGE